MVGGIIWLMEKTTLYLPRELQLALRETARRQGRSQADVAREALERYVAEAGQPRPRSLGAFEQDPARGEPVPAREAKRWVRERWREGTSPTPTSRRDGEQ
jgi:predicted transcriptional regulator